MICTLYFTSFCIILPPNLLRSPYPRAVPIANHSHIFVKPRLKVILGFKILSDSDTLVPGMPISWKI